MDRIGKDAHGRFIVSTKVLADLFGMTTANLKHYTTKRGMPEPVSRGLYDLGAVLQWADECAKANHAPASEAEAITRKTLAQAEKEELRVAEMKGQLVEKGPAVRFVERGIIQARNVLTLLARKIAARVEQDYRAEVTEIVEGEVESALAELAHGKGEVEGL